MFTPHEIFKEPSPDQVIWKYFRLESFIWLLQNSSLWFSHIDSFDDPSEGTMRALEEIRAISIVGSPIFALSKPAPEEQKRNLALVNSWHMSDIESIAMWKIYSDLNLGFAVKTTFDSLRQAIDPANTREIFGGIVEYDLETARKETNGFQRFLIKDPAFKYEQELRLAISNPNVESEDKSGFAIHFDLSKGVEEILVSPLMESWQLDSVINLMKIYGLEAKVTRSKVPTKGRIPTGQSKNNPKPLN